MATTIEIPDSVLHGPALWQKHIQQQLTLRNRFAFGAGEELLYHWHADTNALGSLFRSDVTHNCVLLTNKRLARLTPKEAGTSASAAANAGAGDRKAASAKPKTGGSAGAATDVTVVDVARADIVKVVHHRGGAFADDTLIVSLWDRNTVSISIFSERVCAFFAKVLDDSVRAKHHAPPDFTKFQIPAAVRYGRSLDTYRIPKLVAQHKLLTLSDGEQLQFHYCNTRTNLIVQDETEDCLLFTNRRVVSVIKKKVTLNLPFALIAKARHQKAKTIGYDKVLCTLMSGEERDIPVLSSDVCAFFTVVLHERLTYRNTLLHDTLSDATSARLRNHAAGRRGSLGDAAADDAAAASAGADGGARGGASLSPRSQAAAGGGGLRMLQRDRDFSDDQTYFIVWPSAPHLVLDVQPNPADGSGEPLLILAERTGAISQKWYRHDNGGYLTSCLLSAAYRQRRHKTHVTTKPPDWLFAMKWVPVMANTGSAVAPGAVGPSDVVEIRHVMRLSPEVSRNVYLTIDGVCCGHPDCEEPRVRAGSVCRMALPQSRPTPAGAAAGGAAGAGGKHQRGNSVSQVSAPSLSGSRPPGSSVSGPLAPAAGSAAAASPAASSGAAAASPVGGASAAAGAGAVTCSPLQRWCLKTEFDVFMDDLVSPVLDSLKQYKTQVAERARARQADADTRARQATLSFLGGDQIRYECVVNANCEFSIWRPLPAPGYVMFGDVAQFGYDYPGSATAQAPANALGHHGGGSGGRNGGQANSALTRMAVCAKEHPAFVVPASYALDWYSTVGGLTSVGGNSTMSTTTGTKCYFWRPEPSAKDANCVALGYVVTTDPTPPELTLVRLVHKKYLIENKGAGALAQIWADTSSKVPLYMSLLLNPRNILAHTINHFLNADDSKSSSLKLSGALLPPSMQRAGVKPAVVDAGGAGVANGGGGESDDDVDDYSFDRKSGSGAGKAAKPKSKQSEAAAAALALKRKRDEEEAAKEASMDLLNTAISSVSGVYSFVDGVRVALTAPQHTDVSLSIWNARDVNTFALNTTHARPPGVRYRFPLRDDERRATLLRLYRDGVAMLAECIRQLGSMVTKVQKMERLKQRQKEEEAAARAKAAALARSPPGGGGRASTAVRAPVPVVQTTFVDADPEEGGVSPKPVGVGSDDDDDADDWVDEKRGDRKHGGGATTDATNAGQKEGAATELSYAQTHELLQAIDECLMYEALMSSPHVNPDGGAAGAADDIKELGIEQSVRDSQAKVAAVKRELAEIKKYIKRYVKLDICAELEQPPKHVTNTANTKKSVLGADGKPLAGAPVVDSDTLAWAITRISESWDVLELLPPVDWPEAVSWDFTLDELRIPKVKDTVKMMIANPPKAFNTRMSQWVLDSFRKFIVKRFDSVIKPVFAPKKTAPAAVDGIEFDDKKKKSVATAKGGKADDSAKDKDNSDGPKIAVQTVLDALRVLVDDLNHINRLAGIEDVVQFAARHYHGQVINVLQHRLLRHPAVKMTPGDVGKVVKWLHAYEQFIKPHTDQDIFDEIESDLTRLIDQLTDIYLGLTKSKIVAVVGQVLKTEESDVAPPNRDPSSGKYFSAAPQDFFGFLDASLSQADTAHGMTGAAVARIALAYTHIIKFFQDNRRRYLMQALNAPTKAQDDEIRKLTTQALATMQQLANAQAAQQGGGAGAVAPTVTSADPDVPYYVACGPGAVKPHIYFLGQINNAPLFIHHLENLKSHCMRLISAGVSPAAQAGVALGGAGPAGSGPGVDVHAAISDELENAFDECRQNFLDLAGLCTEVLGRALIKTTGVALLSSLYSAGWLKGQLQVVVTLVDRLSKAYERFRLDTSGSDAIMGKLVKTTLNELVNEYALRFAQKHGGSSNQLAALVRDAAQNAKEALAQRQKFVDALKNDRTTLLSYYRECPYFKSPKVLETEINALAILEAIISGPEEELVARKADLVKRFADSPVRPGVLMRALLEFRGTVSKDRRTELLAEFGEDAHATVAAKPSAGAGQGTGGAAGGAAKTRLHTVLEITLDGATNLQGFPTSNLLAAGAAKLTADPYVIIKVLGGDFNPNAKEQKSTADELKQGLINLFSLDDKPSVSKGPKVLLERKSSQLQRTLEPRWREVVNDIPSDLAAQCRAIVFELWHAPVSAVNHLGGALALVEPDFMGQAVVTLDTIREQLVIQKQTTLAPAAAAPGASPSKQPEHKIRLDLKLTPRPDKPKDKVKGSLMVAIRYAQLEIDVAPHPVAAATPAAAAAGAGAGKRPDVKEKEGQKPSEDLASFLTRTLSFGLAGNDKPKPKPAAASSSSSSAGAKANTTNTTETGGNTTETGGTTTGGAKKGAGGAAGGKKRAGALGGDGGDDPEQECTIM